MSELEGKIVVTAYVTTHKQCGHSKSRICNGICFDHDQPRTGCTSSTVTKPLMTLIERVRSGYSGYNTYIHGVIEYKNLRDKVPDDVISRFIKSIYDKEGRSRLENEPIDIRSALPLPEEGFLVGGCQLFDFQLYKGIFTMVNRRTGNGIPILQWCDTRTILRIAMLLESTDIMNNTINGMIDDNASTGIKFIHALIKYLKDDTSSLTSEMTIVATKLSRVLLDNDLVLPSDIHMDKDSIVKLLEMFARNIENGALSADETYGTLFSIGYIRTPKYKIMDNVGRLHDYLAIRDFMTK